MKELGITKGEWQLDELTNGVSVSTKDVDDGGDIICDAPEYAEISMTRWRYNAALIIDAGNTAQKCGLLPSELLRQRDELKEALEEQKRLYFNLFDEDVSCMYCEVKLKRGSAIILCKECAENTEV